MIALITVGGPVVLPLHINFVCLSHVLEFCVSISYILCVHLHMIPVIVYQEVYSL